MNSTARWAAALVLLAWATTAMADDLPVAVPVREVTVFKDGHAFVLHEGAMPVDEKGNVVLDNLIAPVLGTFWPYSGEKNATLRSVVAGIDTVDSGRAARTLSQMLEANIGARVDLTDDRGQSVSGKILAMPAEKNAPGSATLVLVETKMGVRAMRVEQVRAVYLDPGCKTTVTRPEKRTRLTLNLDWGRAKPPEAARVGLVYVQKGIRWVPGYRVNLDGKGQAVLTLQGTLINDLVDLENATVNLVVGVPTIQFADQVDGMALKSLQEISATLSSHFNQPSARTAFALSNAIMTQSQYAAPRALRRAAPAGGPPAELVSGGATEDLHVFTVKNITLKKGQRLVLTVRQFALDYKDVYTLDVPVMIPHQAFAFGRLNQHQRAQYAKPFHDARVMHKVRMVNKSDAPITTAPVMVLINDRLIAQTMTLYTPVGGQLDVTMTAAVNVGVRRKDDETKRTPNALNMGGHTYAQTDLAGTIRLVNHMAGDIEVEVSRAVMGHLDDVGQDGQAEQLDAYSERAFVFRGTGSYYWWPYWWSSVNAYGKASWTITLKPGQDASLTYGWHYFWPQ